jgi:hypothetical protein
MRLAGVPLSSALSRLATFRGDRALHFARRLPLRSATLFIARAAVVAIFTIVGLPSVEAIGTSGGCSKSAMPHEVTSYAADYRTACLREARNQKRFFHKFLLVQVL